MSIGLFRSQVKLCTSVSLRVKMRMHFSRGIESPTAFCLYSTWSQWWSGTIVAANNSMMPSLMVGAKAWRCEQFQLSNVALNIITIVTAGYLDKDEVFANLLRSFVFQIVFGLQETEPEPVPSRSTHRI